MTLSTLKHGTKLERVAIRGAVALAPAREGVIAPDPRDRTPLARRLRTARRPLPTASVLALVAPGLLLNEGKGLAGSPPL